MRARIGRPCACAYASDATTSAARAVVEARRVARGDGEIGRVAVLPGNAGRSLASASTVVSLRGLSSVSTVVVPLRLAICDGRDLVLEFARLDRRDRFAMRRSANSSCVSRVTCAFWAVYSAWPPMCTSQKAHHSPSLIMPSTMRLIAELHAVAHSIHVVGRVGHRLLSAGDDHFAVAGLDRLRGEHHGLETGAADLVDGHRGDGGRDAGLDRRLSRRRLADAALDDVAHDDFFDVAGVDAGALDGGANGDRAELGGGQRREAAEEFADRRAGGRDDDGGSSWVGHGVKVSHNDNCNFNRNCRLQLQLLNAETQRAQRRGERIRGPGSRNEPGSLVRAARDASKRGCVINGTSGFPSGISQESRLVARLSRSERPFSRFLCVSASSSSGAASVRERLRNRT